MSGPELVWLKEDRRNLPHHEVGPFNESSEGDGAPYVPASSLATLQVENARLRADADKLAEALERLVEQADHVRIGGHIREMNIHGAARALGEPIIASRAALAAHRGKADG